MRHSAKHILAGVGLGAILAACMGPGRDSAAANASAASAAPAAAPVAASASPAVAEAAEPGVIASGSNLALASVVRLCTGISAPGDAFTATVTGSVIGSHGAVIPVGSIVLGHVVNSQDSLALAFDRLATSGGSYPIAARLVGSAQTVDKHRCIPEHGRLTIQLTSDLPLGK